MKGEEKGEAQDLDVERGQTEKGSARQDSSFKQTSHDQSCKLGQ